VKPSGRPWTLRGKVAAWSTAVLLGALVLYSAIVYVSLRQVLWHELDERLHNDIETLEGLLQPFWAAEGLQLPQGQSPLDNDDYRWFQVWSPDGRLLFSSSVATATPIAGLTRPRPDRALSLELEHDQTVRVKEEAGHIAGHPVVVRAMASEARVHQEIAEFLWLVGLALPAVVALAAFGGYHLVKRTMRPVDALVAGANAISPTRLDVRLPVVNPDDEVGQIAQAFNATLTKLEASFEQLRRFTANASHELRTPLTALRTTGQAVLTGGQSVDAYREAVADILEDAEHLSRVLDAMILLAQADAGTIPVERRLVDLDALVSTVAKDCEVLAVDKGQTLSVSCDAGSACVDPTVLRIAVANVLHNAIRYSPPSSEVGLRAFGTYAASIIEVQDQGPGIPKAHHPHLFERFYRVDPGRSRALGGVGLGLAMARWSVEAHGGRIELDSDAGVGSTFRLVLPRNDRDCESERLDS
jgi:heavy metal sensor kinase